MLQLARLSTLFPEEEHTGEATTSTGRNQHGAVLLPQGREREGASEDLVVSQSGEAGCSNGRLERKCCTETDGSRQNRRDLHVINDSNCKLSRTHTHMHIVH